MQMLCCLTKQYSTAFVIFRHALSKEKKLLCVAESCIHYGYYGLFIAYMQIHSKVIIL